MRDWISDEMIKRSVARLPRHYGLATCYEGGTLQLSNPQAVLRTTATGNRGVVVRHRPLCSANHPSALANVIAHRLHCRHATGVHFLAEARRESAALRKEHEERERHEAKEEIAQELWG